MSFWVATQNTETEWKSRRNVIGRRRNPRIFLHTHAVFFRTWSAGCYFSSSVLATCSLKTTVHTQMDLETPLTFRHWPTTPLNPLLMATTPRTRLAKPTTSTSVKRFLRSPSALAVKPLPLQSVRLPLETTIPRALSAPNSSPLLGMVSLQYLQACKSLNAKSDFFFLSRCQCSRSRGQFHQWNRCQLHRGWLLLPKGRLPKQ